MENLVQGMRVRGMGAGTKGAAYFLAIVRVEALEHGLPMEAVCVRDDPILLSSAPNSSATFFSDIDWFGVLGSDTSRSIH